jgi:hypothetical protein
LESRRLFNASSAVALFKVVVFDLVLKWCSMPSHTCSMTALLYLNTIVCVAVCTGAPIGEEPEGIGELAASFVQIC